MPDFLSNVSWLLAGAVTAAVAFSAGWRLGARRQNRRWRRLAAAARRMPPASQHLKDVIALLDRAEEPSQHQET